MTPALAAFRRLLQEDDGCQMALFGAARMCWRLGQRAEGAGLYEQWLARRQLHHASTDDPGGVAEAKLAVAAWARDRQEWRQANQLRPRPCPGSPKPGPPLRLWWETCHRVGALERIQARRDWLTRRPVSAGDRAPFAGRPCTTCSLFSDTASEPRPGSGTWVQDASAEALQTKQLQDALLEQLVAVEALSEALTFIKEHDRPGDFLWALCGELLRVRLVAPSKADLPALARTFERALKAWERDECTVFRGLWSRFLEALSDAWLADGPDDTAPEALKPLLEIGLARDICSPASRRLLGALRGGPDTADVPSPGLFTDPQGRPEDVGQNTVG